MAIDMLWSEGTLCPCLHSRADSKPFGESNEMYKGVSTCWSRAQICSAAWLQGATPHPLSGTDLFIWAMERAVTKMLSSLLWDWCLLSVRLYNRASNSLLGLCKWADNPKGRLVIHLSWFPHNFVSGSSNLPSLFTSGDSYHIAGSKIPVSFTFGIDTSDFSDVMQSCHSKRRTCNSTGEQVFSSSILYSLYQWTCLGTR